MAKSNLADNLSRVQQKIQQCAEAAGRESGDIQIIAVSKTRSLEEVKTAIESGLTLFGENTTQDALTKIPHINQDVEWHFIGHLQSKKAGKLPGYFQWIHSVDSVRLAQKLSSAMLNNNKNATLNCLIQVNVSAEKTKSGLLPDEVIPFLQQVLDLKLAGLSWRGLMTIGVQGDEAQTRKAFSLLKQLQKDCQSRFMRDDFDQLSMGMSGDYCIAIEEGATMVRIGTSIFGLRV